MLAWQIERPITTCYVVERGHIMGILTPLVFVRADKVALIKKSILTPPDPNILPWSPMPRLDEKAIELKERQEEAQKQREAQQAEATKRAYSQSGLRGPSLFGDALGKPDSAAGSSGGFAFSAPPQVRKPNLSGALRKLEESRSQTASIGLPGSEVPPGFADLGDLETPPGFAAIERKAEEKKQTEAGMFGHVEGAPRRRFRNEERDDREKTLHQSLRFTPQLR